MMSNLLENDSNSMKFWFLIFISLITLSNGNSQCEGNLVQNGSFELDSVGENITGRHWIAIQDEFNNNSPDIDNADDEFPVIGNNTVWSDTIRSSCNGGNWQNIASITSFSGQTTSESISQEIEFKLCLPHIFEFEFTAQDIKPDFPGRADAAIDVYMDDKLVHTTEVDSSLFT